jgi:hypothetical protein
MTAGPAELDAARPLARLGVTPDELLTAAQSRPPAPTFAESAGALHRVGQQHHPALRRSPCAWLHRW